MARPKAEVDETSTEVHAVLETDNVATPPLVSMSFQGTADPVELWNDLERLGWIVPARPPRPASAIEWVHSDGRDNEFHVRPYRIHDFRLLPGDWPAASRPRVGALTVSVLQRHDVQIHADQAYLQLIFPAQLEAESEGIIDLRSPADPLPNTLIIERASSSMAALCDYRTFDAASRSINEPLVWAERARQVARKELRAQRTVVKQAVHAWRVGAGDAPTIRQGQERSLRIVVPDVRASGDLVKTLRSIMDDRMGTLALTPMSDAVHTRHGGLLIIGSVASDRLVRTREVLIDRYPFIVVRM